MLDGRFDPDLARLLCRGLPTGDRPAVLARVVQAVLTRLRRAAR